MADETKQDKQKKGHLTVQAIVTRADGTVEDLGIVSDGYIEWDSEGKG